MSLIRLLLRWDDIVLPFVWQFVMSFASGHDENILEHVTRRNINIIWNFIINISRYIFIFNFAVECFIVIFNSLFHCFVVFLSQFYHYHEDSIAFKEIKTCIERDRARGIKIQREIKSIVSRNFRKLFVTFSPGILETYVDISQAQLFFRSFATSNDGTAGPLCN